MLISLLVISCLAVVMLFVIWLTNVVWVRPQPVEPLLIEPLPGGGSELGDSFELEPPGVEEAAELSEPELERTLDAVTELLSSQKATLDMLGGESFTDQGGDRGDPRVRGPGEAQLDILPRWKRWAMLHAPTNITSYARQLDQFGIELAAVGNGSPAVDYAFNFSHRQPDRRSGGMADESRLYMTWQYGPLLEADRELLRRANIPVRGRVIMHFIPPEVENHLANLEQGYIKRRGIKLEDVKETTFAVRTKSGKYEFYVSKVTTH
jgi:hypothetical protein